MIAAVVLAAGAGARLGRNKALCTLPSGETFLEAICSQLAAARSFPIVVVTAAPHGEAIRQTMAPQLCSAINPHPERGMLSSVKVGVAALPNEVSGALVWPVDTPLVRSDTVRAIVAASDQNIVVPEWGGRGGHPIFLPRGRFAELLELDDTLSLKALMPDRDAVFRIKVDDESVLWDVDLPADLARIGGG